MSGDAAALNFETTPSGDPSSADPPQVFVRTFQVPPGAPWTQVRAAGLEARHGAPLPIADLLYRVKRQEPWAPGRSGRFAAFYIRRSAYQAPFETLVDVDGVPMSVGFGSKSPDLGRLRSAALTGGMVAVSLGLLATAAASALNARATTEDRLEALGHRAERRLHQARQYQSALEGRQALARVRGASGLGADVLDDLDWLTHGRNVDVQVLAVHWDQGLLAVESRGDRPPVTGADRQIVQAPRPIRPGVSLWGVGRDLEGAGATTNAQARRP